MNKINSIMKKQIILFVLFLGLGLSCTSTLPIQKNHDELVFPELKSYTAPKVETFTTDNGIRFYLLENKELPVISLSLTVRGGDITAPNSKAGMASILGSVMRSGGSESYPADTLNELLENKAASIETYMGFSSGGASMRVLKEDFDLFTPVLIDILMNPALPQDKIDLDKKQTKSGITRRNDDAQAIANREFERLIYGANSVYGRNVEMANMDSISREDLVAMHNTAFVGANMYIGVTGDFDTNEMKAKLIKAFSGIPKGVESKIVYPAIDYKFKKSINFINKEDINQSVVFMGHIGGKRNDDYAALTLMNEILSGGFSGRLMQSVRTDLGLAYSVFGAYESQITYPGQFYAGVFTKSETTAAAIDAILVQLHKLQDEEVSAKELKDAKDRILNSTVFRYDSRAKILNERISNEYLGLPADTFEKFIESLKKTSAQDVQRVAKQYLNPDKVEILVVGNKNEIGDQLDRFGKVNEIDITIPIPGMEKKAITGDVVKGKAVLAKMAKALVSDSKVKGFTAETETSQFNPGFPGGSMKLSSKTTVEFPGKISSEMNTPQGLININVDGASGSMSMGAMSQPLPPAQVSAMKTEMQRNPIFIAANLDQFEAGFTGEETIEKVVYEVIQVNANPQFSILVDKATGLPMYVRYTQLNPRTGEAMNIVEQYSDWKNAKGIKFAAKKVTMLKDNKLAEMITKSWKAN